MHRSHHGCCTRTAWTKRKYVLTLAGYACQCHHVWSSAESKVREKNVFCVNTPGTPRGRDRTIALKRKMNNHRRPTFYFGFFWHIPSSRVKISQLPRTTWIGWVGEPGFGNLMLIFFVKWGVSKKSIGGSILKSHGTVYNNSQICLIIDNQSLFIIHHDTHCTITMHHYTISITMTNA